MIRRLLLLFLLGFISSNLTLYAQTSPTNFTATGTVQTFTVPAGVTQLTITTVGADGGNDSAGDMNAGGQGATRSGIVSVTPGDVLNIIVGQAGTTGSRAGGGGGGSGVYNVNTSAVLIVAGGGGGGQDLNSGIGGGGGGTVGAGTGGAAGTGDRAGGGGGGASANGTAGTDAGGTFTTRNGAGGGAGNIAGGAGGAGNTQNGRGEDGGFGFGGGGGGGQEGAGGGGGYTGGAGGGDESNVSLTTGGSSFLIASGTSITDTNGADGAGAGAHGSITIEWAACATPTVEDAPFIICDTETTTDLSENEAKILGGQDGTVSWFNGMPSSGTALTSPVDLNTIGDLWAKVTLTTGGCMDSVDVSTTIHTTCITWTGAANDYDWDTGANWSGGAVPADDACVKITASDCPITKTGELEVNSPGLLSIGEGVHLIITGGSGTGIRIEGRLDNKGTITIEAGYSSGLINAEDGKINNAACASIITQGSTQGIFVNNKSIAVVNNGVIEATTMTGTRGINTQGPIINNGTGTIFSSPALQLAEGTFFLGSITNNGQIFSTLISTTGTYNGNVIEPLITCPTITSTVTDVCVGSTITIVADIGTFLSDNDAIAEVDASGVVTGIAEGTAKITVTDGTCTIHRVVTVHPAPTPVDAPFAACTSPTDLTANDMTILDGDIGTVTWFDGTPSVGTALTTPTAVDLTTVTDLWAKVTLDECLGCMDSVDVTFMANSVTTPVDAPFIICDTETTTDLTENNLKILGGQTATVSWFDGMPSSGTLLPSTVDLNTIGDLWAKVTSGVCMDSVDVTTTIKATVDCITWTGAANDYDWDTGANWSGGAVPSDDACVKITASDCPITKTGELEVNSPGLLSISEGVHLIITGGSGTGLTVNGRLDNKGTITIEAGYSNGLINATEGKINNAACASIVTQGSTQGIFVNNKSIAVVNDGVIEATSTGGTRGIQTQGPFINNGTIVSSPEFRLNIGGSLTGNITNAGQIFSVLDSLSGTYTGTAFEALTICPTISSTITDVCIGLTITIAADKGTFTSDNPGVASVDPVSGEVTGIAEGTAKITVTDGTCTIQRIVTVHPQPTPVAPSIIACDNQPYDLSINNTTILDGETGTVEWYNIAPANGGTIIPSPTAFDLTTLAATSDLWAKVTLDDCTACMDTINIPITIRCAVISVSDPCSCSNPDNRLLDDGTYLYQDMLIVDASAVVSPVVTLLSRDGNFLNRNGNPLNVSNATFIDLGGGLFGLEFFTEPDMPGTVTVDVNGIVQSFTTESCEVLFDAATWTGSGDGTTWTDPANWSGNVVPGRNTKVTFIDDAYVTGTPTSAIDHLEITSRSDVSFQLTNLTVSRNSILGERTAVNISANSSLSLVKGEYLFTTEDNACSALDVRDLVFVRGTLNINRGVRATYRPGNVPQGTNRDALVVNGSRSSMVNCGLIVIEGGFKGIGITVNNSSQFYNNGNIIIEPVITGASISVSTRSSFINECLATIVNNNISNSKITVARESFFRNFGFIKSSNPNGAGISVTHNNGFEEAVALNYGYFYNKNNNRNFATGSGLVSNEGERTSIDNLYDLLLEPGVAFSRCSGVNLGCGSETICVIPTMNEWGLFIFGLLLLNLGVFCIRRKEDLFTGKNIN